MFRTPARRVYGVLLAFALLRREQGRLAEAVALYERVLAAKRLDFAPDHPELTEISNTIDALRAAMREGRTSPARIGELEPAFHVEAVY